MKKTFTIILVVLFSIGAISLVLIGYSYFTSFHIISKDQAVTIAMRSGGWTQQDLGIGSATLETKLLQVKLSNHVALVIDPVTMTADPYPVPLRTFNVQDNQLLWEVTIDKQVHPMAFKQWIYEIDATNGTVIQSFTPNG